ARGADVAAVLAPGLGDQGATPFDVALAPNRDVVRDDLVDVHGGSFRVDSIPGVDTFRRGRDAQPRRDAGHRRHGGASLHLSLHLSLLRSSTARARCELPVSLVT